MHVHCTWYILLNLIYFEVYVNEVFDAFFLKMLLMMESNLLPSNEFPSMRLQRAHCVYVVSPIKLNHLSSNGIYIKHDNVGTQS